MLLAHGLGGRSDLPVPLWLAVSGAAAAVVASFFALGTLWVTPRLKGAQAGRQLPRWLERLADARITRRLLRVLGLVFLAVLVLVALLGPPSSSDNPAPTWFFVWFWVGLVPISLLFGPVWRLCNPLRTISGVLSRWLNEGDEEPRRLPRAFGYRPATLSLFAFVWLELVYPEPDLPLTVFVFILLYALVHVSGGVRYGPEWFERGDGFEVYSSLIARLSPLGRRSDGRLVIRNPLDGLAALRNEPELVPVIGVILGSTAFDGLTRTQVWEGLSEKATGLGYLLLGTAGLVGEIAFVIVSYSWANVVSERLAGANPSNPLALGGRFVHSLVPIGIGYTVAHYFSLFVFQGQAGYLLASDPLGWGWNILGTADLRIDYAVVGTSTIALVQVGAIVAGHVLAVVAAHDRAVEILPEGAKRRAQYPLLAVMVVYTMLGIALLVGS